MKLLTIGLRRALPPLGSTECDDDPLARVKFFTPWNSWTWYGVEFDGEDLFWGLVDGHERELGYFSLKEIETIRNENCLRIEPDSYFEPTKLSELGSPIHPLKKD